VLEPTLQHPVTGGQEDPMRCGDIMRRHVEFVAPDATVGEAAARMREHRVGFLPVRAADGTVVGVITDRDIVLRACARHLVPDRTPVRDVMSSRVLSCSVDDRVSDAVEQMRKSQKFRLVVLDQKGTLVGVISLADLAQCEEPIRVARLVRDVSAREYRVRSMRP